MLGKRLATLLLLVATTGAADRIGTPVWRPGDPLPRVDTATVTVYTHLSYTRFGGRTLLQLNYLA